MSCSQVEFPGRERPAWALERTPRVWFESEFRAPPWGFLARKIEGASLAGLRDAGELSSVFCAIGPKWFADGSGEDRVSLGT